MQAHQILLSVFLCLSWIQISAWNQWNYSVTWSDIASEVSSKILEWEPVWNPLLRGDGSMNILSGVPRPRRGHSLVIVTSEDDSALKGDTYLVMFGGRDNDGQFQHVPKTYAVETLNGTLEFTTYDEKPVNPCQDKQGLYYTAAERSGCTNESIANITIGIIYNDVWAYKLCPINSSTATSTRYFNNPCEGSGWVLWHPGALQGGCRIELGIEVCTVPSERYNHGAVMFADGAMYVYGGYSQRCSDYCDDIWFFDIYMRGWRQVYESGALTYLYYEKYSYNITKVPYTNYEVPRDNSTSQHAGPGKRWRHSMVAGPVFNGTNGKIMQMMYIFGGHRLWHGFNPENSQFNNWNNYTTRELGGFLDDFWIYTKELDFTTLPAEDFKTNDGSWQYVHLLQECISSPGLSWASRSDVYCYTTKPSARAGHGSAYDAKRFRLWLFGGYSTYYPYLRTDGEGSGAGITSLGTGGFVPYPGYEYFKNDLWYYSFNDSLWHQVTYPDGAVAPAARTDMVFILVEDILFLHGGFADSYYFDDTWYFNISAMSWLQKKKFMYPTYPKACTDDFEYIQENNCTELLWPKHLIRGDANFTILPYLDQPYYWPGPNGHYGPYWPIRPKDYYSSHGMSAILNESAVVAAGTPLFPYAATGPRQYAKTFLFDYNSSFNATLYEYCTSVFGEPTRGKILDGLYGRSSKSVFISQPRRQRPGWDGCRDRYDNRTDLPNELQYMRPLPRSSHRAVYHESGTEIFMYGGIGYEEEQPVDYTVTFPSSVLNDMWYFNINQCMNNCSNHGDCYYGFCKCRVGYYGEDCSNISCPGTFCNYDPFSHEQSCFHACHGGYNHTDSDNYVSDIPKLPCSLESPGKSNGVCDGYGTAQCAPPFLGDDCSIKDCPSNCSFNGYCSIKFPVSRCMCLPGFFGGACEFRQCLNNCSYPNGACNITTGECVCRMMYSPYNNTRSFYPWGGEDCSYLMAYASAPRRYRSILDYSVTGLISSSAFHFVSKYIPVDIYVTPLASYVCMIFIATVLIVVLFVVG